MRSYSVVYDVITKGTPSAEVKTEAGTFNAVSVQAVIKQIKQYFADEYSDVKVDIWHVSEIDRLAKV